LYTNSCTKQSTPCPLVLSGANRCSSFSMMLLAYHTLFLALCTVASGLTPAQWRSQSIYQVITDRFARTDSSTTAACDLNRYCGGTWQGLINKLDYIQNMGFSAVSVVAPAQMTQADRNRSGSHLLYKIWHRTQVTATHTTVTGRPTSTKSIQTLDLLQT
jgi:hypothetical protein